MAVAGFRHDHIFDIYNQVKGLDGVEIVAACEENGETRQKVVSAGLAQITHTDFNDMLDSVPCEVVAVGDYYAKRGGLIIRALSRGKHVISDKPICTSLSELAEIKRLSGEKGCKVGCMLDLRDSAGFIGIRKLVRSGIIGEVHAVSFGGQHPLRLGVRPGWYFEPGKHGGTINDIAVHAIDIIPWITGLRFSKINAARCWNAFAPHFPHFKDAGQMMLTMENNCGVLGDVSYFLPDSPGYSLPFYWRFTFFGRKGVAEISRTAKEITLALNGEKGVVFEPLTAGNPGGYLISFIKDIKGEADGNDGELNTQVVLQAAYTTLMIQKAADGNSREVIV